LWRKWQASIFLRYALLGLLALPAIVLGGRWLLVALLVWFVFILARAVKAIRENRKSFPAGIARNILRLFVLAPIIVTLDAAAFVGSARWLLLDQLRMGRSETLTDDPQ
jgi:hypothetical protein